jgi:hypothetical protein
LASLGSSRRSADRRRPPQSVQVVLRYADARRGLIVADAHVDDEVVKQIASAGRQQARRGRRPKQ